MCVCMYGNSQSVSRSVARASVVACRADCFYQSSFARTVSPRHHHYPSPVVSVARRETLRSCLPFSRSLLPLFLSPVSGVLIENQKCTKHRGMEADERGRRAVVEKRKRCVRAIHSADAPFRLLLCSRGCPAAGCLAIPVAHLA